MIITRGENNSKQLLAIPGARYSKWFDETEGHSIKQLTYEYIVK